MLTVRLDDSMPDTNLVVKAQNLIENIHSLYDEISSEIKSLSMVKKNYYPKKGGEK